MIARRCSHKTKPNSRRGGPAMQLQSRCQSEGRHTTRLRLPTTQVSLVFTFRQPQKLAAVWPSRLPCSAAVILFTDVREILEITCPLNVDMRLKNALLTPEEAPDVAQAFRIKHARNVRLENRTPSVILAMSVNMICRTSCYDQTRH